MICKVGFSRCHSRFPTAELDPSTNTQFISKIDVLLTQGLTPTVLSLLPLPTYATKNRNLPIPIYLQSDPPPQTASKPPDLPGRGRGTVWHITRTLSHACPTCAPSNALRIHPGLNTFFQTRVSSERRIQERISGSYFCLFASFISPIVYLFGTHKERKPFAVLLNSSAGGRE
ncbi:hypothetical protein V8E53_000224 [Lactarius tabidus]